MSVIKVQNRLGIDMSGSGFGAIGDSDFDITPSPTDPSHSFTVNSASGSIVVQGSGFAYFGTTPFAGTVTSLDVFGNFDGSLGRVGKLVLDKDHTITVGELYNYLSEENYQGLFNDIFGGKDTMTGGSKADVLMGYGGNDILNGGGGVDKLYGGEGKDILNGGTERDLIYGGSGADILTGGFDASDKFIFTAVSDSSKADGIDLITDLTNDDFIDLSAIDAKSTPDGNQQFFLADHLGAQGSLTVTYNAANDLTYVKGDTDGDGMANFVLTISGDHHDFTNFIF